MYIECEPKSMTACHFCQLSSKNGHSTDAHHGVSLSLNWGLFFRNVDINKQMNRVNFFLSRILFNTNKKKHNRQEQKKQNKNSGN